MCQRSASTRATHCVHPDTNAARCCANDQGPDGGPTGPGPTEDANVKSELIRALRCVAPLLRRAGPFLALELVLPGGTALALLLYAIERRRVALAAGATPTRVDALVSTTVKHVRCVAGRVASMIEVLRLARLRLRTPARRLAG